MSDRKLASVQIVKEIRPIMYADKICAYRINGWWVVDQTDKYVVGDWVCYFEIDSWIPTSIADFLSKGKEPREYMGIKGERLRTVRLRGHLSQGLILPLPANVLHVEGGDLTEYFGINKWEPAPEFIHADARGSFPTFFPKTYQERIQNYYWDNLNIINEYTWEVSEKLDGSSFSCYMNAGAFGVCSRNINLKDANNTYWNIARKYDMERKMSALGMNIVIQGEVVGPGLQENIYRLSDQRLYVFDVYNVDTQSYLPPEQRMELLQKLGLESVPIIAYNVSLQGLSCDAILAMADWKSVLGGRTLREGIVFKSDDGLHSFKAINNAYLL